MIYRIAYWWSVLSPHWLYRLVPRRLNSKIADWTHDEWKKKEVEDD